HAFDRMAERIESLLREQERLVGAQRHLLRDVSHELRSPLARLGVALELARDRVEAMAPTESSNGLNVETLSSDSTRLNEVHDRIEREVGRLSEMIDRLLMLARLESGVQAPEATPVDLTALVHLVATDADFEARPRRRVVSVTACADCTTRGARDLLRSAIENVVRNALRHTPEDTAVEVSLRREEDWAVIAVRDRGPGVPAAELGEIFRPFYRAGGGRDRDSGGAGLGLAITERAVQLHGGSVRARNAPDGGLIVEIRLPLCTAQGREDAYQRHE
ncbi:MAG: ATP-binding protein, partial [Armatimonadota bacterium]|nr:ATP-binding protein [Armatimonadota bacterium]